MVYSMGPQDVARLLREAIANRSLQAGALISAATVAQELEVPQRLVVRALRILADEGWVTLGDQPGEARVASMTPLAVAIASML